MLFLKGRVELPSDARQKNQSTAKCRQHQPKALCYKSGQHFFLRTYRYRLKIQWALKGQVLEARGHNNKVKLLMSERPRINYNSRRNARPTNISFGSYRPDIFLLSK